MLSCCCLSRSLRRLLRARRQCRSRLPIWWSSRLISLPGWVSRKHVHRADASGTPRCPPVGP